MAQKFAKYNRNLVAGTSLGGWKSAGPIASGAVQIALSPPIGGNTMTHDPRRLSVQRTVFNLKTDIMFQYRVVQKLSPDTFVGYNFCMGRDNLIFSFKRFIGPPDIILFHQVEKWYRAPFYGIFHHFWQNVKIGSRILGGYCLCQESATCWPVI